MKRLLGEQFIFGLISLVTVLLLYLVVSDAYLLIGLPEMLRNALRPDMIPPIQDLIGAFMQLATSQPSQVWTHHHIFGANEGAGSTFVEQAVGGSLQYALLLSSARVAFGILVGAPLGFAVGVLMGWSRRVDEYVHPTYDILRSIPPIALLSYFMLWFGHNETHRLLPIVYAVFAAAVIPAYHGVRDIPVTYIRAAQSLGARGRFFLTRVIVPAISPFVLSGLRYCLMVAWMTTVGVEMIMGGDGIGQVIAEGGLTVGVDIAQLIVCILCLGVVGYASDLLLKTIADRFTRWRIGRF